MPILRSWYSWSKLYRNGTVSMVFCQDIASRNIQLPRKSIAMVKDRFMQYKTEVHLATRPDTEKTGKTTVLYMYVRMFKHSCSCA
jgi:hypothetical protein